MAVKIPLLKRQMFEIKQLYQLRNFRMRQILKCFFLEKDRVLNGLGLNDTPDGWRNYQATVEWRVRPNPNLETRVTIGTGSLLMLCNRINVCS